MPFLTLLSLPLSPMSSLQVMSCLCCLHIMCRPAPTIDNSNDSIY